MGDFPSLLNNITTFDLPFISSIYMGEKEGGNMSLSDAPCGAVRQGPGAAREAANERINFSWLSMVDATHVLVWK